MDEEYGDLRDARARRLYGCAHTGCAATSKVTRIYAQRVQAERAVTWWCRTHHPDPGRVRMLDEVLR